MTGLSEAYADCIRLAESHYENFPVASRLLPARLRPHVAVIYAFARTADDFADEPGREREERLRLLNDWRTRLHAFPGTNDLDNHHAPDTNRVPDGNPAPAQIFQALFDTIARFDLPLQLFDDLLDAFTQDVTTTRYATWPAVLDYCRRSANPVGRLVLRLSGYRDGELDAASDAVCTALQLTNFWQDLAIDWSRGRLYVSEDIYAPRSAVPGDLDRGSMSPEWAAALAECGRRTRVLFEEGRPVCDGVSGRLRYELRATWLGGTRILDRLERSGFDAFASRPSLGAVDALVIACGTLLWRATPHSPTRS